MPIPCSACAHPNRKDLDASLFAGDESIRALAMTFGLAKSTVARHKEHLGRPYVAPRPLEPPAPPPPPVPDPVPPQVGHGDAAGQTGHVGQETSLVAPEPAPVAEANGTPRNEHSRRGSWSESLSPLQEKAVLLLATGHTHEAVAKRLGKSTVTIYRWERNDDFQAEKRQAVDRMRNGFESRIFALAGNAVVVAQRMLESNDPELQATGVKVVLNSAVRLAARFKELQVQGYAPLAPMVVFPEGTRMPWCQPLLPSAPPTVDVDAVVVDDGGDE